MVRGGGSRARLRGPLVLQLVPLHGLAGALADALSVHHKGDQPMKYDCKQLAAALCAVMAAGHPLDCGVQGCGEADCRCERVEKRATEAREILAAYDAAPELWDDLLHAARAVVDSWSTGDLAGAVRELAACVVALDGDA